MWKWLKNKGTAVVQAIAPDNIKSKLSVFALNHAPTGILSKLPTLETALIKNVVLGPNAHERSLSIARPLVKRLINHWHKDDKRRLEQIFGRYTRHYPDLESFLFCSELAKYTNKFQSNKKPVIERKNTIAGFLAKKSSDFLRSYVLKVSSNEPTNYKLKENTGTENIFLNLNFKRMDHRVFNIIVDQGLAHIYGGLFYRAVFDGVKSAALLIKDEIDDQNIKKSKIFNLEKSVAPEKLDSRAFHEELMRRYFNLQIRFREFGNLAQKGFSWPRALGIINRVPFNEFDFTPDCTGVLGAYPRLHLAETFAKALAEDLKNMRSEKDNDRDVVLVRQFIDHVDRLVLKHMTQTLSRSAA